MSYFISVIEPNCAPVLLRARGLLIPLTRQKDSPNSSVAIEYGIEASPELYVVAASTGWGMMTRHERVPGSLYQYGAAAAASLGSEGANIVVYRAQPDLNETGDIDDELSAPLWDVSVSILGLSQKLELRIGDRLPLGGAKFPLPYLPIQTACVFEVNEQAELTVTPQTETYLNGVQVTMPTAIGPGAQPLLISGSGWLVTASFLDCSVNKTHELTKNEISTTGFSSWS